MSAEIIPLFQRARLSAPSPAPARHDAPWMRSKRHAKNPLRKHVTTLANATVEANKLPQFIDDDAFKLIRDGIAAANLLALELSRILEAISQGGDDQ